MREKNWIERKIMQCSWIGRCRVPTEERIKWNVIIIVHLFALQLKMNFVQAQQMVYIFSLLFSPFEIPQQEYLFVFFHSLSNNQSKNYTIKLRSRTLISICLLTCDVRAKFYCKIVNYTIKLNYKWMLRWINRTCSVDAEMDWFHQGYWQCVIMCV